MKAWFALFEDVLEGFTILEHQNPHLYFDYYEASKDSRVQATGPAMGHTEVCVALGVGRTKVTCGGHTVLWAGGCGAPCC
ncbi:hypothetical protein GOBAR_AA01780 [Gossypium barbadense]|uniref:Uncharacterized protein n=1 Tax=Gossypium barbadense TaxID=3634 RepID=A0A2P5YT70_GOSBA|nr:hypothetical protein GOBAR_AA01780 [Gossypium barbadense]